MYYEIIVSKKGRFLFSTSERCANIRYQAESLYNLFREKFPPSEDYEISVMLWEKSGKYINMNKA